MKLTLHSKWPLIIVVLVMAALACTCGLPFSLGGITDQPEGTVTDELVVVPESGDQAWEVDLPAEEQGFVMPEMPGTIFTVESGGSIFVPEGALPQGTAINAHNSEEIPLLPEGVQPVGEALIITADAQPSSPVLLRLPIPPGVEDPDDLVVVRTEANGMATLLGTWVDGADLVAYTPGFSQFSIAEFVSGFLKEQRINIIGGGDMLTGQLRTVSATFHLLAKDSILDAAWTVNNKATLLQQGDLSATIQAGQEPGWIAVSYSAINLTHGLRWFASTTIKVISPSQAADAFVPTPFRTSVTADNNALYEDEALFPVVNFHGQFRYPVIWSYAVDGCLETVDVITTDSRPFSIPSFQCPTKSTPYGLYIRAEDPDGNITFAVLFFRVFPKPFMINIHGPRTLDWNTGGVKGTYQVIPNDGYNNPNYSYTWRITPGGDWSPVETRVTTFSQEFGFNQPGEHRLEVRTTNGKGDEAKATLPVVITGADPLDAHILSWPDKIKPGEDTRMTFRAGGGSLVVAGQKGGYKVSIYWGDGTMIEESNVAFTQTGYEPVIFDMPHQWAEPGPYTVMLFVEDPTGTIAYSEADILVVDPVAVYKGFVTNNQGFLITHSDVEIKLSDDLVSATVDFTFEADMKWDDQGVACKAILTRVYSGQAPRGTDLEVTLQLESFTDKFEGSDCADVSVPAIQEQTLVGFINDDGSFSGNMRNVWFITANQVVE